MTQKFRSVPAFLICDEEARQLYPLGNPAYNDPDADWEWSKDNLKEVELGILKKADSREEMVEILGIPAENFLKTIEEWNQLVDSKTQDPLERPIGSMVPVRTPPF